MNKTINREHHTIHIRVIGSWPDDIARIDITTTEKETDTVIGEQIIYLEQSDVIRAVRDGLNELLAEWKQIDDSYNEHMNQELLLELLHDQSYSR